MLGGFVSALFTGPVQTAVVGVAAVAAAAASCAWYDDFGRRDYLLRLAVVAVGAAFAVASARQRERVSTDQQRFRLLSAAAGDADPSATVAEVAGRLSALLVPAAADLCAVDDLHEGEFARAVVAAPGVDAGAVSLLPAAGSLGESEVGQPQRAGATATGLRRRLKRPRLDTLVVPLRLPGGSVLGTMRLTLTERSGRRSYDEADTRFAHAYAEQIGRGAREGGIASEIERLEAQRTAALENLAEAVIIHDRTGSWTYANPAAARLLGYDSPAAMLADPTPAILDRFVAFHEDWAPARRRRASGARCARGPRRPAAAPARRRQRDR